MPATDVHPKVYAATIGAAIATIVIWLINSLTDVDVPTGVEAAITVIATFALGWLAPERTTDVPPPVTEEGA